MRRELILDRAVGPDHAVGRRSHDRETEVSGTFRSTALADRPGRIARRESTQSPRPTRSAVRAAAHRPCGLLVRRPGAWLTASKENSRRYRVPIRPAPRAAELPAVQTSTEGNPGSCFAVAGSVA